jgi:hypothetical protein
MEQNAYNPPRFWWLKRITCVAIAYMIFLLAVRSMESACRGLGG